MDDAYLRGALHGEGLQRALPAQPREGSDRSFRGVRPAHPDRLRPRRRARPRRGGQGGRAGLPPGGHGSADGGHPARRDEHLDDDQRHRGVAAGALHRRRRKSEPTHPPGAAAGHHSERHHQGVPGARHLRLPAGALDAADRGHDRVHRRARPEVEPDQHLLLPPPGGGRHPRAGDRVRDVQRDRGPGRGAGKDWNPARRAGFCAAFAGRNGDAGRFGDASEASVSRIGRRRVSPGFGRTRADRRGLRPNLLLRQRGGSLRRGAREAARDGDPLGGARTGALWRHRPKVAAPALRGAGQLARAHRGAAGEQRAADRAGGAGGHDRARRARTGDPAAGVERGAGPAAPVGPAVVAAHPAGAGVRDRPARVPRPLRGLQGDGGPGGRAAGGSARGDGGRRRARRRGRGGPLYEGGAGGLPPRAPAPDRVRRAGGGRPEPLRRERVLAPHRGRRGRHPRGRSRRGGRADRGRAPLALRARPARGGRRPGGARARARARARRT